MDKEKHDECWSPRLHLPTGMSNFSFWSTPKRRDDVEHLHEDWTELLGDLILVAVFVNLGESIAYAGPGLMFAAFAVFMAVMNGLFLMSLQINRIDPQSKSRVFYCFVLLGIFLMALSINDTTHHGREKWHLPREYAVMFAAGFAISRLGLANLMGIAVASIPELRRCQALQAVIEVVVGFIPLFITWIHETPYALLGSYVGALVVESVATEILVFAPPKWVRAKGFVWPHAGHLNARTGVAVMISLGESILQILVADFSLRGFGAHVRFAGLAFVICYFVAMQYWGSQQHLEERSCRQWHVSEFLARVMRPLLLFAVFLLGVGFKITLHFVLCLAEHDHSHDHDASGASGSSSGDIVHEEDTPLGWETLSSVCVFLSITMSISQFILLILRLLGGSLSDARSRSWWGTLVVRITLALAHGAVSAVGASTDVFLQLDYGVGVLWLHLALIIPVLSMQLLDKKSKGEPDAIRKDDNYDAGDVQDEAVARLEAIARGSRQGASRSEVGSEAGTSTQSGLPRTPAVSTPGRRNGRQQQQQQQEQQQQTQENVQPRQAAGARGAGATEEAAATSSYEVESSCAGGGERAEVEVLTRVEEGATQPVREAVEGVAQSWDCERLRFCAATAAAAAAVVTTGVPALESDKGFGEQDAGCVFNEDSSKASSAGDEPAEMMSCMPVQLLRCVEQRHSEVVAV